MSNTVELNYEQAHAFVEENKKNGFFWNGYDIVKWSPSNKGYMQHNGMYRNSRWGYANKFILTTSGTWRLPSKYVSIT